MSATEQMRQMLDQLMGTAARGEGKISRKFVSLNFSKFLIYIFFPKI